MVGESELEWWKTNRIGGAQEAMMTFLAPASRAIWIISFEVVPRTIESVKQARRVSQERRRDEQGEHTHHQR